MLYYFQAHFLLYRLIISMETNYLISIFIHVSVVYTCVSALIDSGTGPVEFAVCLIDWRRLPCSMHRVEYTVCQSRVCLQPGIFSKEQCMRLVIFLVLVHQLYISCCLSYYALELPI